MSDKSKGFFTNIKQHWNEPDREKGNYVPYKEYLSVFLGVGMNYSTQAPLSYFGWSASCFLIMYHYHIPYLAFAVIGLIGLPLSYLWNILSWVVNDNLGILEKKAEKKFLIFYGTVTVLGLAMIIADTSVAAPAALKNVLDGISGISARSFFKIFGVQLFINAYGGLRNILWRKKLVPKYGRYKFSLYANFIQESVMIVLLGWLPIYDIQNVEDRTWMAYLMFMLFETYKFNNVIENCTQTISPNANERMMIRTWPVKLSHFVRNIFDFLIPVFGIAFDDIRFYKYVMPAVFIPMGLLTLFATKNIIERIPQPPLEKKQRISFWYGISQVLKNKYHRISTISGLLDSLGNGMIDVTPVMYFYSMRMYTQCVVYSLLKTLMTFRETPFSFIAPYFVRKYSFKTMRILKLVVDAVCVGLEMAVFMLFPARQQVCGVILFACQFFRGIFSTIPNVANSDMEIRKMDYQMYLSGERLENFCGVFSWITSPVTTLVGLIIPLIILKSGFNSVWDVLYIDSARFKILAVPMAFDMVGFILMIVPFLFWDYNNPQHTYVMEVLKQREKLAYEGYIPSEYEGGLDFMVPTETHAGIPVNSDEMIAERDEALKSAADEAPAEA